MSRLKGPIRAASRPTAVLIDGGALYLSLRAQFPDRQLDYLRLDELLRADANVEFVTFFTPLDPANEGQQKFHAFLRERLDWYVEGLPFAEALPLPPGSAGPDTAPVRQAIRFDPLLGFALGRLAGLKDVVVVTDSYGLAGPLRQTAAKGSGVRLVFFGTALDPRWHRAFRTGSPVQFRDLDPEADGLLAGGPARRPPAPPADNKSVFNLI